MKTWLKAFPAWLRFLHPRVLRGRLIVVERNGGLGDLLCLFPALGVLRKRHPGACLMVLTSQVFVDFVRQARVADVVLASDTRGIAWLRRLARPLVDCHALLPDERVPPLPRAHIHLMEEFARILGCAGLPLEYPRMPASLGAQERVRTLLQKEGLGARPLLVVHSGPTWPVKQWPVGHWQELTVRLQGDCGGVVVQAGMDSHSGDTMRAPRIPGAYDWINRLTLEETAALLSQARLFIGVDSGLLHLANAQRVPAIGLFGPTDPACFMPPDALDRALNNTSLSCIGCHHHADGPLHWRTDCPQQVQCMSGLGVDLVLKRCLSLLS